MNYKTPKVTNFSKQLILIQEKIQEFDLETHAFPAAKARELHQYLEKNFTLYFNSELSLELFCKNCTEAIDLARPELEKFREWNIILANVSFIIVLMGMGSTVTKIINFCLPESAKIEQRFSNFNWIHTSLTVN